MITLEAVAGDPKSLGENVQLLEAVVANHMAPVLEGEPGVRVGAELVDEDQGASIAQPRAALIIRTAVLTT